MTSALEGRIALVTGASKGIGLAISVALMQAGARVAMVARNEQTLNAAAREVGGGAVAIPCDVSDAAAVSAAIARVRAELGIPSIVVNNAGLFRVAPTAETSVEMFTSLVAVNLVGPFLIAREMIPHLRAAGAGHIVTIGSVSDRTVFPGNAAYSATKYGARAMHEVMRAELKGTGVRTTLVSPSAVDTPIWDTIERKPGDRFTERVNMLAATAVADAVLFAVTRSPETNIDELRLSRS